MIADDSRHGVTNVGVQVGLQDYEPTPLATSSSAISKALLNFFLSSSVACTSLFPPHPWEPRFCHSSSSLPHIILVFNP